MSDELLFDDEDESDKLSIKKILRKGPAWKVMVIDDDEDVHSSTRFALEHVQVDGCPIEIIDVYSAAEAKQYVLEHKDVALALVDVVMESDHAGLDFVRWMRDDLKNKAIRLVLRTGQPGQAPERQVVANYDIDDYKTKSELTSQKLFTLIHASLRSYRHIRALERNLHGLELIINSVATLCKSESVGTLAEGILRQVAALLNLEGEAVLCQTQGLAACTTTATLSIIAATGDYASMVGANPYQVLPAEIQALFTEAQNTRSVIFRDNHCVAYSENLSGDSALIYFQASREIAEHEKLLISMFSRNIGASFCDWKKCKRYCPTAANKIWPDSIEVKGN